MNKELLTTVSATLRRNSYESPEVFVVEVRSEGILCASAEFEAWTEELLPW